ncbi:MAG: RHS repeat protein, partial [Halieaceae bacterium]|nr:RHS repeat protein [Halieaceae bacterium]
MKYGFAGSLALLVPTLALGQSSSADHTDHSAIIETVELTLPRHSTTLINPSSRDEQPAIANQGSETATSSQTQSAGERNYSQRITFSELPLETTISDQYRDRGIVLGGSSPITTADVASSTPPVLAGMPLFEGDITGRFVVPGTDQPSSVYQFTWDIGHFDAVESVQMDFFGPQGQLLYTYKNHDEGSFRYVARGGNIGIASWRMYVVTTEPAGFGIDNLFFSIPGKDDLGREMGLTECALGNPINPAAGNKVQLESDYRGARTFPLAVDRAYNSISSKWTFYSSINHQQGTVEAQLTRPDGKILTYTGGLGFGNWRKSSTDLTGELSSQFDISGNIIGWQFKTLDDQVEDYDASGRLTRVHQRSGISHDYIYEADEILIEHSLGGAIRYQLDASGVINGFTDPLGQRYSYSYSSEGMLSSVSYPGNTGHKTYHYENNSYPKLLTGISDANGDRYASWTYDLAGRATSSEHYNGAEKTTFNYSNLNGPGTSRTTVTNSLGKSTTYYYIKINGVQRVFQVEGHPSPNCVAANQQYQFDSRAFIRSQTDWNGNVTEYVRDSKGRELMRREAVDTAEEREVHTEWHVDFNLPSLLTEPGR